MRSTRWFSFIVLVLAGCGGGVVGGAPGESSGQGTGAAGASGTTGTAGTTGPASTTGGAGTTGTGGTTGSGGTTGNAGTTGAAGSTGTGATIGGAGTTGAAGAAGSAGRIGTAGTTGAAGVTGGGGSSPPTAGCSLTSWPASNDQSGGTSYKLDVAGTMRELLVSVPAGYSPTKSTRVIFAWHALGGTARATASGSSAYYGLKSRIADAIFVSAQGLPDTSGANMGVSGWQNASGRDIAFLRAMLAWLDTNYCVDKTRIFSVGFSYGAIMSDNAACQLGDAFRAIAPVAGGPVREHALVCQPTAGRDHDPRDRGRSGRDLGWPNRARLPDGTRPLHDHLTAGRAVAMRDLRRMRRRLPDHLVRAHRRPRDPKLRLGRDRGLLHEVLNMRAAGFLSFAFLFSIGCAGGVVGGAPQGSGGTSASGAGGANTPGGGGTMGGAGATATAGTTGNAGTTGIAGSTGIAGTSGTAGISGAAGATGPGGTTGPAGTGGTGMTGTGAGGATGVGGRSNGGGAGTGATTDPGTQGDGDFTIGPTYTVSPDLMTKSVPHGRTFTFSMSSATSAIYTGMDPTLNADQMYSFTREVRLYVPQQYVDGTPAPFLVVQDGYVGDVVVALDNLIADKRVPVQLAVFVANGGSDSIGSERGLEYDTISDTYTRFIETEVLPAVKANAAIKAAYPNLTFTDDPEGRGAYGCSSGGAAAFTMGWFSPQLYRRLITYSGTFVDQQNPKAPTNTMYPDGAWEYHKRLIAAAETKPLRVFLQVSEMDNGATMSEASLHNWVLANQRMAAALKAKGYHYRFVYALGAGHCDAKVRRQTLPDTLMWMWRGYGS